MASAAYRKYAHQNNLAIEGVEVHKVCGSGNVVKTTKWHRKNPAINFPAMGIVDGDMPDLVSEENLIFSFPGSGDPELYVVEAIVERIDKVAARLAIALGLDPTEQERVKEVVRDALGKNEDPHLIFQEIGNSLDYLGAEHVSNVFLSQWAIEYYHDDVEELFGKVHSLLPGA